MVRPERLELPAYWFEASRSIQLSYGRAFSTTQHQSSADFEVLAMEEHFNDFIRDDAWKWYSYGEIRLEKIDTNKL